MKITYKLTLLILLINLFTNTLKAQTFTIENVNENSAKNFKIPSTIDKLTFDGFKLKIISKDSLVEIKKINLSKKLNSDNSIIEKTEYGFTIIYNSDKEISLDSEKLFDIIVKAQRSFVEKPLFEIETILFTNKDQEVAINLSIKNSTAIIKAPLIPKDAIVFGILMISLGLVFYTESKTSGFCPKFYKIVPGLFMAYLIPAFFTTFGIISPEWETISATGEIVKGKSQLYYVASRFLLPAALVLMTLSIDLKAIFNLGSKALIMFFTGTVGIIIGGPIAILLISIFSPETVGGAGFDAVWRGLSTLAGSWIGGGANQTAMLEIYQYNPQKYGGMVFVDIVVANIWMAILLIGIGKKDKINKWLKADTTAIEELKDTMASFTKRVQKNPSLTDFMIMLAIAFGTVSFGHFLSSHLSDFFSNLVASIQSQGWRNIFSFLGSGFFWLISVSTIIAICLSFTKAKNYEGAGASKIGSIFIYILVASIGMKMDLTMIFDNVGLIAIGLVWMGIHAGLLILVAKMIKAPYFFLAVGSQANVGGAASAPIVAQAFHPSLASVGVLLAVFGYAIGTVGAILCTILMELSATL